MAYGSTIMVGEEENDDDDAVQLLECSFDDDEPVTAVETPAALQQQETRKPRSGDRWPAVRITPSEEGPS